MFPHEQDSPEEDRRITDSELEYLRTAIGVTNEESVMSPPWKAMMTSLPGKLKIAIRGVTKGAWTLPIYGTTKFSVSSTKAQFVLVVLDGVLSPWRLRDGDEGRNGKEIFPTRGHT